MLKMSSWVTLCGKKLNLIEADHPYTRKKRCARIFLEGDGVLRDGDDPGALSGQFELGAAAARELGHELVRWANGDHFREVGEE